MTGGQGSFIIEWNCSGMMKNSLRSTGGSQPFFTVNAVPVKGLWGRQCFSTAYVSIRTYRVRRFLRVYREACAFGLVRRGKSPAETDF